MLTDFQLLYRKTTLWSNQGVLVAGIPNDMLTLEKVIVELFWPGQRALCVLQKLRLFNSQNPVQWLFASIVSNFHLALLSSLLVHRLKMKIVGNGFTLSLIDNVITLYFGHSHVFNVFVPVGVVAEVVGRKSRILVLTSRDSEGLKNFCYKLQQLGQPDAYRGKGLRFVKQQFRLKEGKKKFI